MIRAARPLAVILGAAVALTTLTACIQNNVSPAQSWLDGQDGVASAAVVVDSTSLYSSFGVVRGELEPGIDAGRLDALVDRVLGYARDHTSVELRLGYGEIDFVVEGDTTGARALWTDLLDVDGLVAAVARADGVLVHVMRPELRQTLASLRTLDGAVEIEAFRTEADEQQDRSDDDYGPPSRGAGSYQFLRGATCDPPAPSWERILDTAALDAIAAGTVDACGDYDLIYDDDTDLSAVAAQWAAAQAAASDPVPLLTVDENGAVQHSIAVTPGDASLFGVVAPFEQPGGPLVRYVLSAEGTLLLTAWDDARATELLGLLTSTGLADRLTSIELSGVYPGPVGGEQVTATGTLEQLGTLVADAEALMPLDPSFYQVAIDATSVSIDLYSPPGSDPDMASAAVALRSSPIWTTRDTYVNYLNGFVIIHEGVAALGAESYTDQEPYDAFIAAWNAGATP